jgi:tRNA A-37 threonylcarbamoyl transferase component Bud32
VSGRATPPGYERVSVGRAELVAVPELVPAIVEILRRQTMLAFAASQPDRRELSGRGVAYAIAIPGTPTRAVVRHNRHGGFFARVTDDLFLRPTRAPKELELSGQLVAAGIPTPRVLGYVVYDVGGALARSDVMTREIAPSQDLGAALGAASPESARHAALRATATLVAALARSGAHHRDLNVKNVLLAGDVGAPRAYVLDVDRITFGNDPRDALARNLDRLERSARKQRDRFGAVVSEADLAWLRGKAATI